MSRRLVSCVRPDRISSPMISTAAVTLSFSLLAIGPALAYIHGILPDWTTALDGLPATADARHPGAALQALLRRRGLGRRDGDHRPLPEPRRHAGAEYAGPAGLDLAFRRSQAQARPHAGAGGGRRRLRRNQH